MGIEPRILEVPEPAKDENTSKIVPKIHPCQVGREKLQYTKNPGRIAPTPKAVFAHPSQKVTKMEPAVKVVLTERSCVYSTDDFDDSRREASNRASRPRLEAVPTAEFRFCNRMAAVNHQPKHPPPIQKNTK